MLFSHYCPHIYCQRKSISKYVLNVGERNKITNTLTSAVIYLTVPFSDLPASGIFLLSLAKSRFHSHILDMTVSHLLLSSGYLLVYNGWTCHSSTSRKAFSLRISYIPAACRDPMSQFPQLRVKDPPINH